MPALTADEVAAFLGGRGQLSRGATSDADGFPRVLPPSFSGRDGTPRCPVVL